MSTLHHSVRKTDTKWRSKRHSAWREMILSVT